MTRNDSWTKSPRTWMRRTPLLRGKRKHGLRESSERRLLGGWRSELWRRLCRCLRLAGRMAMWRRFVGVRRPRWSTRRYRMGIILAFALRRGSKQRQWFRTGSLMKNRSSSLRFPDAVNTHSTLLGLHLLSQMHSTSEQRVRSLLYGSGLRSFVPQACLHGSLAVSTP